MIEDADGNICVVRETSLVLYDVARDSMTVYGPNDLGENLEFTEALPELIPLRVACGFRRWAVSYRFIPMTSPRAISAPT